MPITFGRYTDAFKPKAKLEFWNSSEKLYDEKKYFDSYIAFLNYLKDDRIGNVDFSKSNGRIDFKIYQGSKLIYGSIDEKRITAESKVAGYEKISIPFMRRLMEMNYTLYYTRFALKDNDIYIKFDSSIPDGSPRKLYYALKELAVRADKQDDILTDSFSVLKPVDLSIQEIPQQEKEIKYKYFRKWIEETLKRVSELKEDSFSGAISYLLLNLIYKIDYLIAPEGTLMNDIEKMSFGYFARDNKPFIEKNNTLKQEVQKLLEKPKEKVFEDLYRTRSTFGIANPAPHQAIVDTFNSNINNVKWYVDNNYEDIAAAIFEYMAGFLLFSYGMAKPDAKLFHLLIYILNDDYFSELGFMEKFYDPISKKFEEQKVKDRISDIIEEGKEEFPGLKFNTDNLKFDTMVNFLRSFVAEMQGLDFNT
jgi:hypothetical protein